MGYTLNDTGKLLYDGSSKLCPYELEFCTKHCALFELGYGTVILHCGNGVEYDVDLPEEEAKAIELADGVTLATAS